MTARLRHHLAWIALAIGLSACQSLPPVPENETASAQTIAAASNDALDVFRPVSAANAMVATADQFASQVGLNILQSGGNAVDAAVGIGFALAVVLPQAGNIGGGGFMLVHEAKSGATHALDFRETAPAAASSTLFLDEKGEPVKGKSLYSHSAVGVPGTVAGLLEALEQWGTMKRTRVIAPAIRLAAHGFKVNDRLARALEKHQHAMAPWPQTTDIFWRKGVPLQNGDTLVQKDLARSLRLIARQGKKAFYQGRIAQKIVAEMKAHGEPMNAADLRNYKALVRTPLRGHYRKHEIITMPPPSSGGVHLIQMLNMLETWPLRNWGVNSVESIHHSAEAMKLAYADRAQYLGDPDFVTIPLQGLLSKRYARQLAAAIDSKRARPSSQIKAGTPPPDEGVQTTHYSVVDKKGNAVAVTYTLNTAFGSGIVASGTGILLNNEMDDFAAAPGVPNAYGLTGGAANQIEGGKRPLSSMTPTLVMRNGKPWLVTGSPGGSRIITTVLQTVSNAIDFGMNPAQAAYTPRFHHQWQPDMLDVEKGFSVDTLRLLEKRGHRISIKPPMGNTQTIQIEYGGLLGASDPRDPYSSTLGY